MRHTCHLDVDVDEWLKVTSSWRMRSRSPSPHNIQIRPASSSHIVPNRSITAGQKSEDTPAANGPYFCVFCRARRAAATPHEVAEEGRASSAPPVLLFAWGRQTEGARGLLFFIEAKDKIIFFIEAKEARPNIEIRVAQHSPIRTVPYATACLSNPN